MPPQLPGEGSAAQTGSSSVGACKRRSHLAVSEKREFPIMKTSSMRFLAYGFLATGSPRLTAFLAPLSPAKLLVSTRSSYLRWLRCSVCFNSVGVSCCLGPFFRRYLGSSSVPGKGLDSCGHLVFFFSCCSGWRFRCFSGCCFGLCFSVVEGLAPGLVLAWSFQFLLVTILVVIFCIWWNIDIARLFWHSNMLFRLYASMLLQFWPRCEAVMWTIQTAWLGDCRLATGTLLALPPLWGQCLWMTESDVV